MKAHPLEITVRRLDGAVRWLGRRHYWATVMMLLALALMVNGLAKLPGEHYLRVAQNPYTTRKDIDSYNGFQESILLPVTANLLGIVTSDSFAITCFLICLLGIFHFARQAKARTEPGVALLLLALLLFSPLAIVLFSWIGQPDCLTFLFVSVVLFTRSAAVLSAICFLGGLNHPCVPLAAPGVLLLRAIDGDPAIGRRHAVAGILASALGAAGVRLFNHAFGIEVLSRWTWTLGQPLSNWLTLGATHGGMRVFSLLGCLWPVAIACIALLWRMHRRHAVVLSLLLGLYTAVAFLTLDITRIFILLTWAPLFHALMVCSRRAGASEGVIRAPALRAWLLFFALASPFYPRYFVWADHVDVVPQRGARMVQILARKLARAVDARVGAGATNGLVPNAPQSRDR